MNKSKTPSLRFEGFSDDWEQRKLSEFTERVRGNDGRMNLPTLTMSASLGWMSQEERFSANIAGKEQKNYTLLRKGELSYNHGNSKLAKYGVVFVLKNYDEALVPRVYHSFKVIEGNSFFIEQYFTSKLPDRELGKLVSSGARMDGLLNINYESFINIKLTVPDPKEQIKIGNFFKQLDKTITLQERELNLLKEQKKGFLQKMFPKDNEKVPELRFEGFDDDWEQRKLGEDCIVRDGTHDSPKYFEKGFPLVTSKNLKSHGLDLSDVSLISNKDFESINNRSKVDIGDILFGMIGSIGNPVQVDRDDFAIKNVALIKEQKNISNTFLIQLLKSPIFDKYIANENAGGTQKFLSLSKIRNFEFLCPNSNEQKHISDFFKQLDETITLQEQQLEKLKEMKKGFLQKMFV